MSPRPKLCSGATAVKKLGKVGWKFSRQKGSHVMLVHADHPYTLSISQHRELGVGLLSRLIKQAELTVDEFESL